MSCTINLKLPVFAGSARLLSDACKVCPVRARIAREQRDLCDRGVGADEEIRPYPGAASSLSTITPKHLTGEKQRKWAHWSVHQLDAANIRGPVMINAVVYAEFSIGYARIEEADRGSH